MKLEEFHNITPICNIPSILQHGILSYARASKLRHSSVALPAVQSKRDERKVPGGLALHEYANVYFHARNPMMFRLKNEADQICVLQVSTEILNIAKAVVTDGNAASNYVRFYSPERIGSINLDDIFARNWKHPDDQIKEWRHKTAKCAEVLIPNCIPIQFLLGAYVLNETVERELQSSGFSLPVCIDPNLFFC
ncbi:MAG: DUF4433 domain-containing protein [Verrucomicrobiaceae bacterium]|nr:MAG: DUF4433 domain-containing protein [Verrucomicrobiaceae bacterium]